MNNSEYFIYLLIMAGTTYLIRAIPFALLTKKIKNIYIRSFLDYIPYTVLTAMTVPAIFYATKSIYSAIAGFVVAVLVTIKCKNLTIVALSACLAVFIVELFLY